MPRLSLVALLALAGCSAQTGDSFAGAKALIAAHCATCHIVPGVPTAQGRVGPSLAGIARQQVVAGTLPNTPANMRRWLQHPKAIQPRGAMPEMGLSDSETAEIADYLSTLDRR